MLKRDYTSRPWKRFPRRNKQTRSRILSAIGYGSGSSEKGISTFALARMLILTFCLHSYLLMAAYGQNDQSNIRFTEGNISDSANLSMEVPLGNYKGRGIDLPVSLSYSSNIWSIEHLGTIHTLVSGWSCCFTQSVTEAIYAKHSTSGWKSSLDLPVIEFPKSNSGYEYHGRPYQASAGCFGFRISEVYIHMPDGSTHTLRKSDQPASTGSVDMTGTFYAIDGSRMRFDANGTSNTGTIYMPDGSTYVIGYTSTTSRIYDRNGNYVEYNTTNRQWTDTLGRQITNPLPASPTVGDYTYSLPGLAGVSGGWQTFTFRWKNLEDVLTPVAGSTPALRVVGSEYLPTPGSPPTNYNQSNYPQTQPTQYGRLFQSIAPELDPNDPGTPRMPTLVVGHNETGSTSQVFHPFNPVVLAEIDLPDGTSYKFTYNVYGEVDTVVYPTTAYEKYEYTSPGVYQGAYDDDEQPYVQTLRSISSRKQSISGAGNDILEWQYISNPVLDGGGNTTIIDPDGTKTFIQLLGPGQKYGDNSGHTYYRFGDKDPRVGMVESKTFYSKPDANNARTMLRRDLFEYEAHNSNSTEYSITCDLGQSTWSLYFPMRRAARLTRKTNIIFEGSSALAQSTTFDYDTSHEMDTGLDQTEAKVYDYVDISSISPQSITIVNIPLGNPLKSTATAYSQDTGYRSVNLLGLPTSVTILNPAGTPVSKSEMVYDESGYIPSGTHRALPSTSRVWDSTKGAVTNSSAYLVTHATFDTYGNRTIATDAKGFHTTTTYDSTYHAYPISVTTEAPDSTGVRGSNSGFTTSVTYDGPTGLVLSTIDINGETSLMEYEDPLLRPTKVTAPNGQETITEYGEGTSVETRKVTVKSQITANQSVEVTSYYDGLGRTYLTQKIDTSDPDGHSYAISCYDSKGRVSRTSNPFRGYSGEDCSSNNLEWTVPEYDDLNRAKKITMPVPSSGGTPGNVVITYGISTETGAVGTTKTITDEAGKQRKGITDALGNMVRVIEDPAGQNLNTDYTFDTLGNLRKTTQGDQIRYFNYDSLGRVLRAKQVEQDVNTSLALSVADLITGNNSWSVKYTYDDNSNILTTTNARNQTITATYDHLNRITDRDYDDDTPDVDFYYDGRGLSGGIPEDSLGKTTKVYSSVSETKYTAFDNMGRATASEQKTDGKTYGFSYGYNLAGALTEETYPSGRVVKTTINSDGELVQVQSKKNSSVGFFTYADGFRYNASGAVTKMQLGNGHWETASYDERQQLTQIGLGTRDDQQDLLKLEFGYTVGVAAPSNTPDRNNGSMRSQTITVPGVTIDGTTYDGFMAVQEYGYDGLNRLTSATEHPYEASTTTWKQEFSYDRYGNKNFVTGTGHTTTLGSCATAVCNPAFPTGTATPNRNRFADGQGYNYDADGNLLQDMQENSAHQKFGYDAEGRQIAFFAKNNSSSTNPTLRYAFDGEGKRIKKYIGNNGTIFVYDAGGKLVGEYETTTVEASEDGYVPKVSYMTYDHIGSPRIVTDQNGSVVSRKDFGAFGDETITTQRTTTLGYTTPDIRQDYTGYQKDEESGLEYAQARYYNPQHGRFTSVDPLPSSATVRNPQSFNRYSYVLNSPYKFTDPLGLMTSQPGCSAGFSFNECGGENGFFGGSFGNSVGTFNRRYGGLSRNISRGLLRRNLIDNARTGYDMELDRFNDGTIIRQVHDGVPLNINASGWSLQEVLEQFSKFNAHVLEEQQGARRTAVLAALNPLINAKIIKILFASGVGFKFAVLNQKKFEEFLGDPANKFKSGLLSPFHLGVAECGLLGAGCIDYRTNPSSAVVDSGSMQITYNAGQKVFFADIDRFSPFHNFKDFVRHNWYEVVNGNHGQVVRPPVVLDAIQGR